MFDDHLRAIHCQFNGILRELCNPIKNLIRFKGINQQVFNILRRFKGYLTAFLTNLVCSSVSWLQFELNDLVL